MAELLCKGYPRKRCVEMHGAVVRGALLCAVVWVAVPGCEFSGESSAPSSSKGKLKSTGTNAVAERPFGEDPSEKMLAGERVQSIDWDAAAAAPAVDQASVPESVASFFDESPVPVLLPPDRQALQTMEPTMGDHWYATVFELDGREVTVEGDRVARRAEELPDPAAPDDERFRISQTHGVITVSFTRFGAAYTLDVECERVDSTGRCSDESFAVGIADRLATLGGER